MRTKHSTQTMGLVAQDRVFRKSPEILKIFLVLVLIIGGRNQETDGEGLNLRSGLCQDLSLGGQSLTVEKIVI